MESDYIFRGEVKKFDRILYQNDSVVSGVDRRYAAFGKTADWPAGTVRICCNNADFQFGIYSYAKYRYCPVFRIGALADGVGVGTAVVRSCAS